MILGGQWRVCCLRGVAERSRTSLSHPTVLTGTPPFEFSVVSPANRAGPRRKPRPGAPCVVCGVCSHPKPPQSGSATVMCNSHGSVSLLFRAALVRNSFYLRRWPLKSAGVWRGESVAAACGQLRSRNHTPSQTQIPVNRNVTNAMILKFQKFHLKGRICRWHNELTDRIEFRADFQFGNPLVRQLVNLRYNHRDLTLPVITSEHGGWIGHPQGGW